jgi:hypothetical protein
LVVKERGITFPGPFLAEKAKSPPIGFWPQDDSAELAIALIGYQGIESEIPTLLKLANDEAFPFKKEAAESLGLFPKETVAKYQKEPTKP